MKKIVLAAAALAVGFGVAPAFADDAAKPAPAPMVHHHHHHHHHHHMMRHHHHHHHHHHMMKKEEPKKS
jgi:Ni/Co efflux regulator RcnB